MNTSFIHTHDSHDDHEEDHQEDHDSHDDHDHDHDHAHEAEADIIIISIIDIIITILCIIIVVHFIKYLLKKENYKIKDHNSWFFKTDILSLITILIYSISICIVVVHDILHFVGSEGSFHFELGLTQWILFFTARILLQFTFLSKLYATFWGSAYKYSIAVIIIILISIISLFIYGIYIVTAMGLNREILDPLSHDFATILIFTAFDFALIMAIAYLFVSKLYVFMKLWNDRERSETSSSPRHGRSNSFSRSHSGKSGQQWNSNVGNNRTFLNAISKYSLLTTIISIGVIVHLFALWFISTHYDHDNEVHVEFLQHCVSTIIIFIDTICLYLSCRLSGRLYERFCKYPHKCCAFLCDKTIDIKEQIRNAINPDEIDMTEIVPNIASQSSVSPPTSPDVDDNDTQNNNHNNEEVP